MIAMTNTTTPADAPPRPYEVKRSPGRPRNPLTEQRLLDAAIDEYLERGAAGFTMDGVARRAGVGKSTVYLRWPDRDQLLIESVLARSGRIEDVDTGSLHGDMVQLTSNLLRFLLDPVGYATFRIAVDAVANTAYRQVSEELARRHKAAADRVFERAQARGELGEHAQIGPLVECLYGTVVMKVLAHGFDNSLMTDEAVEASSRTIVDMLSTLFSR